MRISIINRTKKFVLQKLPVFLLSLLLGLLCLFSLQYLKIEIFYKERNIPFSGDYFYNPYQTYCGNTLRANFHAHSVKPFSLNNGSNKPDSIFEHYRQNGYDVISLSDYQKISMDAGNPDYIPVYEHGYNLLKNHQLVINPGRVSFFDFSLVRNYHTEQKVISRLRHNEGMIVLAHPGLWNGYREEDMEYLKGYSFIEVFNSYKTSREIWDAALSCGYPAWILANDDCHDIKNPGQSLNNWTMISTGDKNREEMLSSLKAGCHYGVKSPSHVEINYLDSCLVRDNILKVFFREKADRITFVADNGAIRKEIYSRSYAEYRISNNDSYIRVEARSGEECICLNPVIRYNGYQLSENYGLPQVNLALTIIVRVAILIMAAILFFIILAINGRITGVDRITRQSLAF